MPISGHLSETNNSYYYKDLKKHLGIIKIDNIKNYLDSITKFS